MKIDLKLICFVTIILVALSYSSQAQVNDAFRLQQKINGLKKTSVYITDTAYLNTVNQLGFIYADNYPDSAIKLLSGQPQRCNAAGFTVGEVDAYKILGNAYQTKGDFDTALSYYEQSYKLAKKNNLQKALPGIQNNIGLIYFNKGSYSPALHEFYEALTIAEKNNDAFVVGSILNNIATIHFFQNKMEDAESDYRKMLKIAADMADTVGIIMAYNNIGEVDLKQDSALKALTNLQLASRLALISNNVEMQAASAKTLGLVYARLDSLQKAEAYFNTAITLAKKQGSTITAGKALIGLADVQLKEQKLQPALHNGLEGLQLAQLMGQIELLRDGNEVVATIYEAMKEGNLAIKHYKLYKVYSDSMHNFETERAALTQQADYEFSKKEAVFQRKTLQQQWVIISAVACIIFICIIAFIINRNRKKLDRNNKLLNRQNLVIEARQKEAEDALNKLRETQKQLIQSEKMASLGELTAGIAHEIQNPLNFVNNFSEVNNELIGEIEDEIHKEKTEPDEQLLKELLYDVKANNEKIVYHGKRADMIVKGMLQHSRQSATAKEPTDVNALCSEYARLGYLGFRAKNKGFNAAIITDFDEGTGKVKLVPQDVGHVLTNLFNNAFYAVMERQKNDDESYDPLVSVQTKNTGTGIKIIVSDNGNGIPGNIIDKIFQPFFTTRPTGQGTGLGLSLAYDIVKAHSGEINVETKEGEGTKFIISLPVL